MRLKPQTAGQSLRSVLILFAILGNLIFSVVFVMSMGAHVAQAGTDIEQTAEKNTKPATEQKIVTLAQIN